MKADRFNRSLPTIRQLRRMVAAAACAAGVCLLAGNQAPAPDGEPAAAPGEPSAEAPAWILRVDLPLTGDDDERIKQVIDKLLDDPPPQGPRPTLVLQFWPPAGQAGEATSFERSLALANYLTGSRLARVRTVAYVPRTVKGHGVLAVLACEEIVMHADAELGQAGINEDAAELARFEHVYQDVAGRRKTVPAAIALGMLNPKYEVLELQTAGQAGGYKYILADQLAEEDPATILQQRTVIPAGEAGLFTGRALRMEIRAVSREAGSRTELADALGIPGGLDEVVLMLDEDWRPIRVKLSGVVGTQDVSRLIGTLQDAQRRRQANLVLLEIGSQGGSPAESLRAAQYLAALDGARIRTVAFVRERALADAALVALACDHLVMAPEALLGGSGAYAPSTQEIADMREPIRELAAAKGRRWSLPAAMLDDELSVYHYRLDGTTADDYFCADELAEQADPRRWKRDTAVTTPGSPLQLSGDRAHALGLARFLAADIDDVAQLYNLEATPEPAEANWAEQLIEALAHPAVAGGLLFIGGFALIAELMAPGVGIAGFIAALCYVLYFWSQFLNSTAEWLEILLFVTGLTCLALELFVLPGFGVFGLGGGALILVSLVLASQTFVVPHNSYQTQQLGRSMMMVVAAGGGALVGMVVLRRLLPNAPVLRRVMLAPPAGEQLEELEHRESLVDWSFLLGKRGTVVTRLTPAGKAQFGDQLVDVITDGELVPAGAEVRVVEVSGNHVLVQPLNQDGS